jgi:hypothetical protein
MQRSSLKLYFATLLLILSLTSFGFAGNIQCPLTDPPPPTEGEGGPELVISNTNPSVNSTYQFLKGFWEFLAQSTDLF